MDASQYKDYVLVVLFVKYISDKAKNDSNMLIDVPDGCSFDDMVAQMGKAVAPNAALSCSTWKLPASRRNE